MRKHQIFLVDDHVVLRDGLQLLINGQADMEVVGVADDGHAALAQLHAAQPDIVVMDVSMPGMDGVEATTQIRATWPHMQVVALTRHSEQGYVRQVLQAGARAYVLKQAPTNELLGAIRAVAGGGTYLDPVLTKQLAHAFVQTGGTSTASDAGALSERELEVARLIAHGYGNKEIATQLRISSKTVDTYKARAMEKLGFHNRAALVRYALHQGWLDQF